MGRPVDPTPANLDDFVGVDIYREIAQQLQSRTAARIMLLGPGGSGKTSIALRLTQDFLRVGRTVVMISEANLLNAGSVRRAVEQHTRLDGPLSNGDLLVVDGIDTPPLTSTDPYPLRTASGLAGQAHLIVTGRRVDSRTDERFAATYGFQTRAIAGWSDADINRVLSSRGLGGGDIARLLTVLREARATYPRDVIRLTNAYLHGDITEALDAIAREDHLRAPDLMVVPDTEGMLRLFASMRLPLADVAIGERTFRAAPLLPLAAPRWRYSAALRELEQLINDPETSEHALQQFFETNPHFLAGVEYDEVVPHPMLVREGDGPLIPDFMLAPAAGAADVLDLKLPGVNLTAGTKDRQRMSRHVADAVAQVREYGAYFEAAAGREHLKATYGLDAYRPKLTVVIGRTSRSSDPLQLRRLWDDLPGKTDVLTYDDLLSRAKRLERARGF